LKRSRNEEAACNSKCKSIATVKRVIKSVSTFTVSNRLEYPDGPALRLLYQNNAIEY